VTGPTSVPRGERAGTPGARWETELVSSGERWVPDGEPEPTANRAARRARKGSDGRQAPQGRPAQPQEAREGASVPVSRPNFPQRTSSRRDAENGAQSIDAPAPAHDDGPTVAECAANDRSWPLQKHGE
jgi:hypothetical protein